MDKWLGKLGSLALKGQTAKKKDKTLNAEPGSRRLATSPNKKYNCFQTTISQTFGVSADVWPWRARDIYIKYYWKMIICVWLEYFKLWNCVQENYYY